jgi:hypothetical protein
MDAYLCWLCYLVIMTNRDNIYWSNFDIYIKDISICSYIYGDEYRHDIQYFDYPPVYLHSIAITNNKFFAGYFDNCNYMVTMLMLCEPRVKTLSNIPIRIHDLFCKRSNIISFPSLPPTLIKFTCGYNRLIHLRNLPPLLQRLECYNNNLETLPELPPTLTLLDCSGNKRMNYILPPTRGWIYINI